MSVQFSPALINYLNSVVPIRCQPKIALLRSPFSEERAKRMWFILKFVIEEANKDRQLQPLQLLQMQSLLAANLEDVSDRVQSSVSSIGILNPPAVRLSQNPIFPRNIPSIRPSRYITQPIRSIPLRVRQNMCTFPLSSPATAPLLLQCLQRAARLANLERHIL